MAWLSVLLAVMTVAAASDTDWSRFRGPNGSGVSQTKGLPAEFGPDKNVVWKVDLPQGFSSPIIWENRIFLTGRRDESLVTIAVDRTSGKVLWEKVAPRTRKEPLDKRNHPAAASIATDGQYVSAFFGDYGLITYDMNGKELWKRDLGVLNVGAYDLPEYEWGTASSPIIYKDLAIVQCDTQGESFVLAVNLKNGETAWKTSRKELPSWGTPTVVVPASGAPELVTNASNFVRAYDIATGAEKWRLGGSSKITAPTPIFSRGLIVVASGRAPERPIFAIRPGGNGDITPAEGAESGGHLVWKKTGRGSYMPTPIAYGDTLYVLSNAGLFDAYELETGKEVYRQRIQHGGSGFSASPVAADGRIYLSSEDGDVFVLRAGPTFEVLSKNPMGEPLMATPAIAGGTL